MKKNIYLLLSFLEESVSNEIPKANEDPENNENYSESEAEEVANEKSENKIMEKSKVEVEDVPEDPIGSETGDEAEDEAEEDDEGKIISVSGVKNLYILNLSNCCKHKYDHSISRVFLNLIFGGILLFGPIVQQRANVASTPSRLRWAGSAASKSSLSACRATIAGKPISSFRETVFSSLQYIVVVGYLLVKWGETPTVDCSTRSRALALQLFLEFMGFYLM